MTRDRTARCPLDYQKYYSGKYKLPFITTTPSPCFIPVQNELFIQKIVFIIGKKGFSLYFCENWKSFFSQIFFFFIVQSAQGFKGRVVFPKWKTHPIFNLLNYAFWRLLMVSEMRFLATSTLRTRTLTASPTLTTSEGCFTNLSESCEMCTRPSW